MARILAPVMASVAFALACSGRGKTPVVQTACKPNERMVAGKCEVAPVATAPQGSFPTGSQPFPAAPFPENPEGPSPENPNALSPTPGSDPLMNPSPGITPSGPLFPGLPPSNPFPPNGNNGNNGLNNGGLNNGNNGGRPPSNPIPGQPVNPNGIPNNQGVIPPQQGQTPLRPPVLGDWSNAPLSPPDAPWVKLVFANNGAKIQAFVALSHREGVSDFSYAYGKESTAIRGRAADAGGFIGEGDLELPVKVEFVFEGRRCRVITNVGFREVTKQPDCG